MLLPGTALPGPQTVDLMPVLSSTGTLLMAPWMCCIKTSQSKSKRLKANFSDTWRWETGIRTQIRAQLMGKSFSALPTSVAPENRAALQIPVGF